MSLAAVAVRNQRRRAAQQQNQPVDDVVTPQTQKIDASDPNLKLRKVRHFQQHKNYISLLLFTKYSNRVLIASLSPHFNVRQYPLFQLHFIQTVVRKIYHIF